DQLLELPLVLPLAEARVVPVLPPTRPVLPDRLQLRRRGGRDEDVGPGRGNGQLPDPRQLRGGDPTASRRAEGEPLPGADTADAGLLQPLEGGHSRKTCAPARPRGSPVPVARLSTLGEPPTGEPDESREIRLRPIHHHRRPAIRRAQDV